MFITADFLRRFLLVAYSIFIGMGLTTVAYGIYLAATTTVDLEDLDGFEVNGVTAISGGIVDICIGIFGIVGVLHNRRIFLMIIIVMLAGAIVMNMLIMVVTITSTNSTSKTSKTNIRAQIVARYGNNHEPSDKEFTLDIDYHQKKAECCGFSGDESENLYTQSPWYTHANVNQAGKKRTLPDSCCLESGPKCREAENLKEARDNKYVYQYDCFSKLVSGANLKMWLTVAQMLTASLLQGVCIAATLMKLLNVVE